MSEYTIIIHSDSLHDFVLHTLWSRHHKKLTSIFLQYPGGFITYSLCQYITSHIVLSFIEIKLEQLEESDSKIFKLVLICENLFSNLSAASLAKILEFHVLFADSLEFICFSPTHSDIERGWCLCLTIISCSMHKEHLF